MGRRNVSDVEISRRSCWLRKGLRAGFTASVTKRAVIVGPCGNDQRYFERLGDIKHVRNAEDTGYEWAKPGYFHQPDSASGQDPDKKEQIQLPRSLSLNEVKNLTH